MGTDVHMKWVMLLTPNIKMIKVDQHSLVLKNRTNFQDLFFPCDLMGRQVIFYVSSFNIKIWILKYRFTFRI